LNALAGDLNTLITQINSNMVPGKAQLPSFQFSTEGSQVQALTHQAITLEKCLNALSEQGILPWIEESRFFGQLSVLISTTPQITPEQFYAQFNAVIDQANAHLPKEYKIPTPSLV